METPSNFKKGFATALAAVRAALLIEDLQVIGYLGRVVSTRMTLLNPAAFNI